MFGEFTDRLNDTAKLNTKYIISKYIYFGVRIREAVLSAATSQEAHRVPIGPLQTPYRQLDSHPHLGVFGIVACVCGCCLSYTACPGPDVFTVGSDRLEQS